MIALLAALLLQDSGGSLSNGSTYLVRPPTGYHAGKKWPMLIVLHGNGDRAENFIRHYEFPEARGRWVIVAINAKTRSWDGADMNAIVEATNAVAKSHAIDPDLIFLAGFSGGAMMGAHTAMFQWPKYAGFAAHSNGATSYPPNLAEMKALHAYVRCGTNDPMQLKAAQDLKGKFTAAGLTNLKYEEVKGMGHTFTPADAKLGVQWMNAIVDQSMPRAPAKLRVTYSSADPEALQRAAAIVWEATLGLVQIERFDENARGEIKGPIDAEAIARTILQSKYGVQLSGTSLADKEFEKLSKKLNAPRPRKAPAAAPEAKINAKK